MKLNFRKKGGFGPIIRMIDHQFVYMHPFYDKPCETDPYYAGVAKKLVPMLEEIRKGLKLPDFAISRMAMCLAVYLEDVVSNLGLWAGFIQRHRELYGHWLPWYDTSGENVEYFEDQVNEQDVRFLLWLFIVATDPEADVTSPEDTVIERSAKMVFNCLLEEFEIAPVNQELLNDLYREELTKDFYSLKKVLLWMAQSCYLLSVPLWQAQLRDAMRESIQMIYGATIDMDAVEFIESSYSSLKMRMGPLALYPTEWLVLMRRQKGIEKDNDKILAIEGSPFYPFTVEGINSKIVKLRSIRDVVYPVERSSFNANFCDYLKGGEIIVTTLARYDGVWRINGISTVIHTPTGMTAPNYLNYIAKNLVKDGKAIDLLGMADLNVKSNLGRDMINRFKDAVVQNHGKPLFYFPDAQASMKFEEKMLGRALSDKEAQEYLETYHGDRMMVFFDNKESMFGMARAETIHDPENPYYDRERAYLGGEFLYDKSGVIDDLTAYLVKNKFLAHLNFNIDKEDEHNAQLIAENLPFFASFMRQYPC